MNLGHADDSVADDSVADDSVAGRLAAIWREELNADQVSKDSDFFELGGHSLVAIRVCVRASEDFGVDVEVADLIMDSSFQAMSDRIEVALNSSAESSIQPGRVHS